MRHLLSLSVFWAHLGAGDVYGAEATPIYLIIQHLDRDDYTLETRAHLLRVVGGLPHTQQVQDQWKGSRPSLRQETE